MINTEQNFESKIPTVQTLLHSQGITQNFFFQGKFYLEDQGQGHQFSNSSETFMWSIHGSSLKVKFKMPQSYRVHKESHRRRRHRRQNQKHIIHD